MRNHATLALLCSLLIAVFPMTALAQDDADHSATIDNALSAAPAAIAANAAVVDVDGNIIREGSNGYTCMADNPANPASSSISL